MLKNVYKLLSGIDNPWTVWIRRWYFHDGAPPATPLWGCYASLVPLMRSISTVRVRDGATTSFWFDNWTSIGALSSALPSVFSHCLAPRATVADEFSGAVTLARRDRVSPAATAEFRLVEGTFERFSPTPVPDECSIIGATTPGFWTTDAYRLLHSSGCGPPLHDLNWDNFAPVKVKVFIWILRHRRTRTRARLFLLGILSSSDYPFCAGVPEDVHHLFVACPRLLSIWARASLPPPP
jgi:hypothetical protein